MSHSSTRMGFPYHSILGPIHPQQGEYLSSHIRPGNNAVIPMGGGGGGGGGNLVMVPSISETTILSL